MDMAAVSTRSRPKAAGRQAVRRGVLIVVSTRSRPKAAGSNTIIIQYKLKVSTRSRPKAAGRINLIHIGGRQSFNTQPPEGGWVFA